MARRDIRVRIKEIKKGEGGGGVVRASPASAIKRAHRTCVLPCEAWSLHGCFLHRCLYVLMVDPLLENVVLSSDSHLSGWRGIVQEARQLVLLIVIFI